MVRTSDLVFEASRVRFSPGARKFFVAPGEHGFSFLRVKMFTGSVRVLLTSASLKLKSNYQELGYTIHLMSDPEGNS